MLGRKLRMCGKGEKNCYRFSNALAKYMTKKAIDRALDHYLATRKEPLLSWGLRPVSDTRKTQIADWSKKSQHWRESRSLKEESGHNKSQCPSAQQVAEVGRGEEYEVQEDDTKLPSFSLANTQKTLSKTAIKKLSEIIKRAEKEGNLGYEQAKKAGRQKRHAEKHINKHKSSILDLVEKYGKMFAKKWLQKQKTSSSGFRELLLDAVVQLITHGTSLGSDIPKEIISNMIDVGMDLINEEDV